MAVVRNVTVEASEGVRKSRHGMAGGYHDVSYEECCQIDALQEAGHSVSEIARQAADQFLPELASSGKGEFVDAAGGESMIGNVLLAILGT